MIPVHDVEQSLHFSELSACAYKVLCTECWCTQNMLNHAQGLWQRIHLLRLRIYVCSYTIKHAGVPIQVRDSSINQCVFLLSILDKLDFIKGSAISLEPRREAR